jgi:chemotaxis protein MotC
MRRVLLSALGACAMLSGVAAEPVSTPPDEGPPVATGGAQPTTEAERRARREGPVAWVRTLQLLQDRIAAGSVAAHESQPLLIGRINGDLLNAAPEVWADRTNVRAAIAFALSGGGPAVLRRLTAQYSLSEPEATLARGALAFTEGREAEATRLLRTFDTTALPPTLAGAITLTQATLAVTENPLRAIELLDRVRVLLPGTLAEEGALRREIFALGQLGDLRRFEAAVVQYLHRFPRSVYAGNFRQRLAYQLTLLDVDQDAARFAVLDRIVNALAPESRRDLYLLIARTAVQEGKTGTALLAADRALTLCAPGSPEALQGRLYRAAAEIVALPTFEQGQRTLRSLDRGKLPARDTPLLDAALSMADQIGRGLAGAPAAAVSGDRPDGTAPAPDPVSGPAGLLPKAQATIDRVDQLLRRATP